ncbi:unnamed protein product [Protopolystoma xenopodis]|uniref:Uncharacterized protein n=1 Tax=Protopolystoma xenopodis TaxID=117903 RepID=A0A3S5BD82_9PLAT|nr:unnamed protein product [Protopolystoma xenopodis]
MLNHEIVGPFLRNPRPHDVVILGDIVDSVGDFVDLLNWRFELSRLTSIVTTDKAHCLEFSARKRKVITEKHGWDQIKSRPVRAASVVTVHCPNLI